MTAKKRVRSHVVSFRIPTGEYEEVKDWLKETQVIGVDTVDKFARKLLRDCRYGLLAWNKSANKLWDTEVIEQEWRQHEAQLGKKVTTPTKVPSDHVVSFRMPGMEYGYFIEFLNKHNKELRGINSVNQYARKVFRDYMKRMVQWIDPEHGSMDTSQILLTLEATEAKSR